MKISACPICGRQPDIDRVDSWPRDLGPVPWYAGCYGRQPIEHYIGGDGDTRDEVVAGWESAVASYKRLHGPGRASGDGRTA